LRSPEPWLNLFSLDVMNPRSTSTIARLVGTAFGGVILVFVIVVVAFVVFKQPPLTALYGLERWVTFAANLCVAFYAFPAYKRTKRHGFLYSTIAAVIFAYTVIFGLLVPSTHYTRGEREWYYVARQVSYIVGLGFYARGIMLLTQNV
jgi:hypothetical protein